MICFAILTSMPFVAFATKSSSVPLNGGTAAPGQSITINGDKLYDGVFYNVRCIIRMPSSAGETSSHIQAYELQGGTDIRVNYHPVDGAGQSQITPNTDNDLFIPEFRDYSEVTIRNLDRDNTLTVSDCIATPRQ